MSDLFERVDCLLHDAEHAEGGASMARAMGDHLSAYDLATKAKALRDEANEIDPDHTAPGWEEDAKDAEVRRASDAAFAAFMASRGSSGATQQEKKR